MKCQGHQHVITSRVIFVYSLNVVFISRASQPTAAVSSSPQPRRHHILPQQSLTRMQITLQLCTQHIQLTAKNMDPTKKKELKTNLQPKVLCMICISRLTFVVPDLKCYILRCMTTPRPLQLYCQKRYCSISFASPWQTSSLFASLSSSLSLVTFGGNKINRISRIVVAYEPHKVYLLLCYLYLPNCLLCTLVRHTTIFQGNFQTNRIIGRE